MSTDQITRFALKPASVAAVSAAAAMALRPGAEVIIGGGTYPLSLVVAGASFLASEVSEYINSTVFPHIPRIGALSHPVHSALNMGVVAGGVAFVENYASPGLVGDLGIAEIVGVAALAEVAGTYISNEWLKPMWETSNAGPY
jgi:hypothetical protein